MYKNKNIIVIAIVSLVNSLGYGIIIPIFYSYSLKFGLNDFENGLLFAVFSICQFLATPIIGRLSDKYGRKPLLLVSLFGTAVSFFMAAFAPNAIILFISRALDGVTAGNIPVASAVISDTTDIKDRAKGFGIIGASFGFGFVFGPAISALTVGFGIAVPFIIAGVIALLSVFLTAFLLPETNKNIGKVKNAKIFDFKKLVTEILNKNLGMTFLISLIYSFAFGIYIFSFQPFAIKILNLSTNGISEIFTMFGVIGLISQGFILPRVIKKLNEKKLLIYSFFFITLSFFAVFFVKQVLYFVLVSIVLSFSNSFIGPLIQTILSKESDEKSQGTILGLNSSYISLGSIFGPVAGGFLAIFYIPLPFLLAGFTLFICMLLSIRVIHLERIKKESAF